MKKKICILGSTGSIGTSTLKVLDENKNSFLIDTLVANSSFKKILYQIRYFKPRNFIITNYKVFSKIKNKLSAKNKIKLYNNYNHIIKQKKKYDITISAIPGIAGLEPTLNLTKKSKKLLIANKEAIICGWSLIKNIANKSNTKLIPIDSEHYSIYELTKNFKNDDINEIFITASGGPFLKLPLKKFSKIKPEQAIKHPKWSMGKKISVDSATLMNKVLEILEANKIFPYDFKKYKILIHPQCLVHAIVNFKNGLSKMIYHLPDMKIPISNAIFSDDKKIKNTSYSSPINFLKKNNDLTFLKVDKKRFPSISILKKAQKHPSGAVIINGTNEILVDLFLKKKITFNSIMVYLSRILKDRDFYKMASLKPNKLKNIYKVDKWSKVTTMKLIRKT